MAKQHSKADQVIRVVLYSAKYGNTSVFMTPQESKLAVKVSYFLSDSRVLTGKREFRYSHTTTTGDIIFYEVYPKVPFPGPGPQ